MHNMHKNMNILNTAVSLPALELWVWYVLVQYNRIFH